MSQNHSTKTPTTQEYYDNLDKENLSLLDRLCISIVPRFRKNNKKPTTFIKSYRGRLTSHEQVEADLDCTIGTLAQLRFNRAVRNFTQYSGAPYFL